MKFKLLTLKRFSGNKTSYEVYYDKAAFDCKVYNVHHDHVLKFKLLTLKRFSGNKTSYEVLFPENLFRAMYIVMYKTIRVINIIIYMCLNILIFYEYKTAVFVSLRERICSLKEFAPLRMSSLLLKEFAKNFL